MYLIPNCQDVWLWEEGSPYESAFVRHSSLIGAFRQDGEIPLPPRGFILRSMSSAQLKRDAALLMLHELTGKGNARITAGADKAYDTRDFVDTVRELGVTPHVARRQHGAIDERTSRHPGYAVSLSKRWLVEKPFGWLKQIGPLKKVKLRGLAKVDWLFVFSCAAFNLIRIPKLRAQSA